MTITEFLLARIAEDEAAADRVEFRPYLGEGAPELLTARVLAECEAKRRIVESHPVYRGPRLLAVDSSGADTACEMCHATSRIDEGAVIEALGPCDTLRALASVYADHPDLDPAWLT